MPRLRSFIPYYEDRRLVWSDLCWISVKYGLRFYFRWLVITVAPHPEVSVSFRTRRAFWHGEIVVAVKRGSRIWFVVPPFGLRVTRKHFKGLEGPFVTTLIPRQKPVSAEDRRRQETMAQIILAQVLKEEAARAPSERGERP